MRHEKRVGQGRFVDRDEDLLERLEPLDEGVTALVGRVGRAEVARGDSDSRQGLLALGAAAVSVLVEEHRHRGMAPLGQLFVGHPPAAVERIAAEAEAQREIGPDPAAGIRVDATAQRELAEMADVAELELGRIVARDMVDIEPQLRILVERSLDGDRCCLEAVFGPAQLVGRLAADRHAEDPRVRQQADARAVAGVLLVVVVVFGLPVEHEAGERHARQHQRGARENFVDVLAVALGRAAEARRQRHRHAARLDDGVELDTMRAALDRVDQRAGIAPVDDEALRLDPHGADISQ